MTLQNRLGGHTNSYHTYSLEEALEGIAAGFRFVELSAVGGWTEHVPLLAAGKHVLLEKPFALTVADCNAMIAAWQASGNFLMIGQTLRFWPEYKALVSFVQSGAIGKPFSAIATRLSQQPAWSSWFTDPAQSGGAVIDLMIHDIDALNWLFGQPQSIYCRGRQSAPGMWDHLLATVDYGTVQPSSKPPSCCRVIIPLA